MDQRNADVTRAIQHPKGDQQPDDDTNHHHDVEDLLDLPIHREVGVDQPERDPDDDE